MARQSQRLGFKPGNATVEAPGGSTFAVFSPPAERAGAEPHSARRSERRAVSRRLHDAATSAVAAQQPLWLASCCACLFGLMGFGLVGVGWSNEGSWSWLWFVLALVVAAGGWVVAWMLLRHAPLIPDSRLARRWIAASAIATAGTLALAPWSFSISPAHSAQHTIAPTIALACLALIAAFTFAPIKPLAALAIALPLSPAVENLAGGGPQAEAMAAACIVAAGLAALIAVMQHRRWYAEARARIAQADRIRALEAARDAAIKADQEKSRFLAIASHDLRQPVHAIGLFAATLEKRLQGSAEEPLIRNLNRAIDGLDRSFNVMLDISRLDAGAIEPRVQHFPLRDLFRRLHMHFAGQAEQKGLGLRFSPGGKSISSDPQLLERVLGNLVQNAIKYTDEGGIVVVARSTAGHINVEIWDTGVGIRPADLRKVFDEFYQVGGGQRVRAQGLGMGLAIVKRLVRLLGHELTVSSRPGKGTMFRLRIALGGLPEIQDLTAAADTVPAPILQARTVLVLDDEEPIREGLQMLLQEWGYEAIAAASINEALREVAKLDAPPDLILSDLHLGDGPDGIAGIEAIRRQCGCEITAMLITGDTSHTEIRRATESGHPVLFKPVQPRKLYDALRGLGS